MEVVSLSHTRGQITVPWNTLVAPVYDCVDADQWKIIKHTPPMIRGYYSGFGLNTIDNYVLLQKPDKVWMSLTPMELESQAPHAHYAYGHTVVGGLGMGMVLYNILKNPNVDRVTVVEKEQAIIDIFHECIPWQDWDGMDKVTIVNSDIFDYVPEAPIDFLATDIHSELGSMELREDTQRICKRLQPALMGVWGIELDFVSWCSEVGIDRQDISDDLWEDYCVELGAQMPFFEGIADYCLHVTANMYLS